MTRKRPADERKKGTVPICRNGPEGAAHKWGLSPFSSDESFRELLDAACNDALSDEQFDRLEAALAASEDARREYLRYFTLGGELRYLVSMAQADATARRETESFAPPPISIFQGVAESHSRDWTRAYLFAAVALGLFLLLASWVNVTHVTGPNRAGQLADQRTPTPEVRFVGRITGMKDCRWADHETGTYVGSSVSLGRDYALASGLMEISYEGGARVILEGPCAYTVESSAGGFLAIGKLTANIRTQSSKPKAQSSNPSPLPPLLSPLFFVRTPTAIITDLGTEFGVEVAENGDTTSYVFQGSIKVQGLAASAASGVSEKVLQENESIRVSRVRAGTHQEQTANETVRFTHPIQTPKFVRRLAMPPNTRAEEAYIKAVLADKPLGYWPLNESAGATRFRDRSGNDFHGYRMGNVLAGRPGPLPGDSRAIELEGDAYIDVGRRDRFALANGFTVEAWIWIRNPSSVRARLFSAGNCIVPRQLSGWAIGYVNRINKDLKDELPFCSFTCYGYDNRNVYHRVGMPLEEWFHVAMVFDKDNVKRLYFNGKLQETFPDGGPAATGPTWVSIGWGSGHGGEYWRGRIAHVAVFDRVLSEQRILNHCRIGRNQREDKPMD
ncbi:MAG: hypothetical protein JW959_05275 [Pirellulales bacterium]|nr:hypothetical protein [Pirellulales bacterium]